MPVTRWYIGVGKPGAMRYLLDALPSGELLWTEDRDCAHRFDRREDAAMMALQVASADPRATVSTVPDDRRVAQQDEAKRQMLDGALAALHEAGALTRNNVEAVGREMRCGPGPDRPEANTDRIAAVNAVAEW